MDNQSQKSLCSESVMLGCPRDRWVGMLLIKTVTLQFARSTKFGNLLTDIYCTRIEIFLTLIYSYIAQDLQLALKMANVMNWQGLLLAFTPVD